MKTCLLINIKHIVTCKWKCTLMTLNLGVNCGLPILKVQGMTFDMEYYENYFGKIYILIRGQIPIHLC